MSDEGSLPPSSGTSPGPSPGPGMGGETIQLDALVEGLDERAPDPAAVERASRPGLPPPLPPKKASKSAWIAGVAVVLLAIGLGLGGGWYMIQQNAAAVDTATPPLADDPVADDDPADEVEDGESAPSDEDQNVVELDDDIVFEM